MFQAIQQEERDDNFDGENVIEENPLQEAAVGIRDMEEEVVITENVQGGSRNQTTTTTSDVVQEESYSSEESVRMNLISRQPEEGNVNI